VSERLLTASEVAERLSVPESWVRAETRAGRMPHIALGRYRRYQWDAVVCWLEGQREGQWPKHKPHPQLFDNEAATAAERK
jgi:excisionase family DNA binding protein